MPRPINYKFTFLDYKRFCSKYKIIAFSSLLILIISLYLPTFEWLVNIWTNDEQYSHGFLVPLVTLYLIWVKRDWLQEIPVKPSLLLGCLFILVSLSLLIIGRNGAFIHAEGISLFFIIPAIVLFIFGWRILRVLSLPLFYLQFMIPWLDPVFEKIQPLFQTISATIGARLLALVYPVYSDDTYIQLPNISLVVARECSGINFLVTILAIGLPLVYLSQKTWARAIAILITGCLLSILSNGLRVAIAGVLGEEFGPEMLHGPAHIFEGWSVAWVGWIGLFFFNWLFIRFPYRNGEPDYLLYERWRRKETQIRPNPGTIRFPNRHFSILLAGLLCFSVYLNLFTSPQKIPLNFPLSEIPTQIAGWQGVKSDWLDSNKYFPELDDKLSRIYRNNSGNTVYLFIGYYQLQDNNRRLISYHAKQLYENSEIITIETSEKDSKAVLSSLQSSKIGFNTLFWYNFSNNLKMTNRLDVKLHTLKNGIFKNQNNGAIIIFATRKNPFSDRDVNSISSMKTFATELEPVLSNLIP